MYRWHDPTDRRSPGLPFQNVSGNIEREYFVDGRWRTSSQPCRATETCSSLPKCVVYLQGPRGRHPPSWTRSRCALCPRRIGT